MFRPFEDGREENPVESFFGYLDSSHQVTRFFEAEEERRKPISVRIPVLFGDDLSSSDDDGFGFSS